jgi:hypothetical protein
MKEQEIAAKVIGRASLLRSADVLKGVLARQRRTA